ncbi:MAG: hypothetical protein ACPL07_00275 [Candidatus Bathyarchaeia archaeon]
MAGVERVWLEFKPYFEADIRPLDEVVRNVLVSFYNYSYPVKFLIMYDGGEGEVKRIRFFMNVPKHFAKTVVEAFSLKKVLVIENAPPKRMYRAYARLKLLNYYAYPILPLTYEPKENYVDMIVASMVGRGNCVCEIDFVGSLTARANVLNFLSKKYFKKSTGVKQLFTKGSSKDASVLVFTPLERTLHDAMKEKAVQEVYVCRVMVRGMDADDVRAVVSSFPRGGMNDFRAAYVRVKANSLDDVVKPKLSYMKKYAVYIAGFASAAALCLLLLPVTPVYPPSPAIAVYAAAASLPPSIAYALVKKLIGHDICLNVKELSLIVSLPTRKENLPIEFAPQPPRRIELPAAGESAGSPGTGEGEEFTEAGGGDEL